MFAALGRNFRMVGISIQLSVDAFVGFYRPAGLLKACARQLRIIECRGEDADGMGEIDLNGR
jgi:hypothetical protein